jgi:hypothetical protein
LPYLVMEYVEGASLQDRLDRGGPLPPEEILQIGIEMATGVAAAHAQGLIHRDIKPANILLAERPTGTSGRPGVVKITDFGLARAVDDTSLTQRGVVAGTPQYMAPEQARGEALDHRADLFSLGSVLYALCTGQPPFGGEGTVAVLFNVCAETPRPIQELNPAIPDWFVNIVDKLHAKKPADRFQSAAEVADLLLQYQAHLHQPSLVALPRGPGRQTPQAALTSQLPPHLQWIVRWMTWEYRSKRTLWGLPLVHIASGFDLKTGKMRTAKGVLALGGFGAQGVVAIGGVFALGAFALSGVLSVGLLGLAGSISLGLVAALAGGAAIGSLAMAGGFAVGVVAIGAISYGYYALGPVAGGHYVCSPMRVDPEALRFFRDLLGSWVDRSYGPPG